jgi:TetR/AcrR family transcriptional repressor of mexJK operon
VPQPQQAGRRSPSGERSARKRGEILAAARRVFTSHGYLGTSMDAVAAEAGASKRTVYQYFTDKQDLFSGVVLETVDRGYEYFKPFNEALAEIEGDRLEAALQAHARRAMTGIMSPEVLRMRRLVIAEAERFPSLGREYYERSWVRTQALLAQSFATLDRRGLLRLEDAERAAYHFVHLIVSIPLTRTSFLGDAATYTDQELNDLADAAVGVFLAAYTPLE